jgi:hypothetical protein
MSSRAIFYFPVESKFARFVFDVGGFPGKWHLLQQTDSCRRSGLFDTSTGPQRILGTLMQQPCGTAALGWMSSHHQLLTYAHLFTFRYPYNLSVEPECQIRGHTHSTPNCELQVQSIYCPPRTLQWSCSNNLDLNHWLQVHLESAHKPALT